MSSKDTEGSWLLIPCILIGGFIGMNIGVWIYPREPGSQTIFALVGSIVGGVIAQLIINVISAVHRKKENKQQQRQRDEAERQRQRQQDLAEMSTHEGQQRHYFSSFVDLGTGSFALFEALPKHLMTTEELLDQAELDYDEAAFTPFWDNVERAVLQLGHFDDSVRTITTNAASYTDLVKRYQGPPPPFPIIPESVTGLKAANSTSSRLRAIVRKAQRNFQFATIFEQRRTNKLLVAGFTDLAQALDGMGMRVASSIEDLGGQIFELSSTLDASLQRHGTNSSTAASMSHETSTEGLANRFDGMHAAMEQDAKTRAERHKRALEMLENIQQRTKPSPGGYRNDE